MQEGQGCSGLVPASRPMRKQLLAADGSSCHAGEKPPLKKPEQLAALDIQELEYRIAMLEEEVRVMNPDMGAIESYRRKEAEHVQRISELDSLTAERDKVASLPGLLTARACCAALHAEVAQPSHARCQCEGRWRAGQAGVGAGTQRAPGGLHGRIQRDQPQAEGDVPDDHAWRRR